MRRACAHGCTLAVLSVLSCKGTEVVQSPPPEPPLVPVYNQIIFESNRDDPNGDLYLMDLDGGNVRRFASSPFADICPAFSPDGTRIAFYSARAGNQLSIFVMHSDGSSLRFVDGPVREDSCPHWSADGNRIGYLLDDRSRGIRYGIVRVAEGNGADARTIDSGAQFTGPVLSPDGSRLIYRRIDASIDSARSGVFIADASGGSKRRIGNATDDNLDWSRDRTSVLYGCLVTSPNHYGLCICNPNGSSPEVIPYPYDVQNFAESHFSPDASMIVSASPSVEVVSRSGSSTTYLHSGSDPSWLSDGSAIGFVGNNSYPDPGPFYPSDIFVANKDGSGVRNLTNSPAVDIHPSWSPVR